MICKICGYEANQNFSICPYCGEKASLQNQNMQANQANQYNNQQNQNISSQYQTPFTRPNPQNNHLNQTNQNEQSRGYNYNSDPTLNYQDVPQTINEPANKPVRPVYNPAEFAHFFKSDIGCSFSATENEIKISRFLNDGEFVLWPKMFSFVLAILIVVGAFYGIHLKPSIMNSQLGIFGFLFVFVIAYVVKELGKYATIIVNPNGITTKTMLGKFFIPREKVNYCEVQSVTRWKMSSTRRRNLWGYSRRRREATLEEVSYLDVIIKIKEQNKWKVDTVDTGLCYLYSEPVYYLKDEFNRILDVQEKFY